MKIIHLVLGKANPNRMNGVNKVVHCLSQAQTALGANVEVWGITPTPNDTSEIPPRDFDTKLFPALSHKFWVDDSLKNALKSKNEKIVHMHGGFIPEFFHLQRFLTKNNIPFMITPHGCYNLKSMENGKQKKNTYFQLFERRLLNNAKYLHCLGKSEKNAVAKMAPEVKSVIVPNGQQIEDLSFNYENLKEEKIPVIGFCGRMDKKMKGLDLLLKGYAQFKKQFKKQAKIWLIGGGYDIEELQQLSNSLQVNDDVVFFGPKFGNEKLNTLANCDVFYHPSRYEGMPMSILEACGLGLPCVVSDATNMAEYIKQNDAGLILEPNTIESVAQSFIRIDSLFKSSELSSKGVNAKKMIETQFSWESIAKKFIQLYAA